MGFFKGRNGIDALSVALFLISIVFGLFIQILPSTLILIIWAVVIFRVFSRNVEKRKKENAILMGRFAKTKAEKAQEAKEQQAHLKKLKEEAEARRKFVNCPRCSNPIEGRKAGKSKYRFLCDHCIKIGVFKSYFYTVSNVQLTSDSYVKLARVPEWIMKADKVYAEEFAALFRRSGRLATPAEADAWWKEYVPDGEFTPDKFNHYGETVATEDEE